MGTLGCSWEYTARKTSGKNWPKKSPWNEILLKNVQTLGSKWGPNLNKSHAAPEKLDEESIVLPAKFGMFDPNTRKIDKK
jgi:hypothetical protein